jgi:gliding motility-associated-like protein
LHQHCHQNDHCERPSGYHGRCRPDRVRRGTSSRGFAPHKASFTNGTSGASGYLWEFGDGTTSTDPVPSHLYTREGEYEVFLTAFYGNNCRVRQRVTVVAVEKAQQLPNVFTPNGDGLNDTFSPRVSCLPVDLKVFNRWGKLVYEQANYQNTWAGDSQAEGVYYYLLTSPTGQTWKGWVEIIR